MPDVSPSTLVMCVQAVQDAIKALEQRLDSASEADNTLDDTEMLLAYTRAADELRDAYTVARLTSVNMPAYEKLVAPTKP